MLDAIESRVLTNQTENVAALGGMALTAIGLGLFFRSKGWLGDGGHRDKHPSEADKGTGGAGRD